MSRLTLEVWVNTCSFPRVSGDEPMNGSVTDYYAKFSPRERG